MKRIEIEQYTDMEKLREIALLQHTTLFEIEEALNDCENGKLSEGRTIASIRHYIQEMKRNWRL